MNNINQNEIKEIFNKIAHNYDFMNNVISFFTHKKVRKIAIKELNIKKNSKVLDLCCGSGDFGGLIQNSEIIGADFSPKMIEIAKKKYPNIKYFIEDAVNLTYKNNTFDYVIMGFGLRNIIDKNNALKEIYRVLKNNSYFLHLDFNNKAFINKLYNKIIICLTKFLIKDIGPYEYLVNSKNNFLNVDELIELFESNGFKLIKRKDLMFNIISFQIMQKISK